MITQLISLIIVGLNCWNKPDVLSKNKEYGVYLFNDCFNPIFHKLNFQSIVSIGPEPPPPPDPSLAGIPLT